MLFLSATALTLLAISARGVVRASSNLEARASDPCSKIANKTWAAPADVRACYKSFPVNATIKANILEVLNKTLAFHSSLNFQIQVPPPYDKDVHEDLIADLARISATDYATDLDMHIDIGNSFLRLDDAHCVYFNLCYDSTFVSYVPMPLVLLTNPDGSQNIHIAPEAFTVSSAEFPDQIDVWQNALPGKLKGKLESLSGATVLEINGADPWISVNANAAVAGGFQAFGTRQNGYFASYARAADSWSYSFGDFASLGLPLNDSVTVKVMRVNASSPDTITLPYRSRISPGVANFTDSASYWENVCTATEATNGMDINAPPPPSSSMSKRELPGVPVRTVRGPRSAFKGGHAMNQILDANPRDILLPPGMTPPGNLSTSNNVTQFFFLPDNKTGVMALGSFDDTNFTQFETVMLNGLMDLKNRGASQLIVDISNNGGGFVCIAHWLHRILVGPKPTSEPQAGLNSTLRDGPLARLITTVIASNTSLDPNQSLGYNPKNWFFPQNNTQFNASFDFLEPPNDVVINGRQDAISIPLSDGCQPFDMTPPAEQIFDPKKTAIVGNGRCASSCSLFSITMHKEEGTKTVVYGGKNDVPQKYCGTVGGQASQYVAMDTDIKSTGLKNNSLAPPDFLVNALMGITWRLAIGVDDPSRPEEWQDQPADFNLPLTANTVNNPMAIWKDVAQTVFA